jgi:quercetin dioxygenase-like cupin family protein
MRTVDLAGLNSDRYLFREHRLEPGAEAGWRRHPADRRSFVVASGRVVVAAAGRAPVEYGPLAGWHAGPGAVYRIGASAAAVLLEAGSAAGPTHGAADPTACEPLAPLGDHRVSKPWGHEVWLTDNLTDPPYALKLITMTAGHRSSLQSHERKAETNYVVRGEATVLNGGTAPADPSVPVDAASLPRSVHGPGSGWSSPPGMLHRVIAEQDYTAVEVSTPELDDVLRWQDDTGRSGGRIESEHGVRR